MDFFDHQDRARRNTMLLLVLFILAVILIVVAVGYVLSALALDTGYGRIAMIYHLDWVPENRGFLLATSLGTLAFICLASLWKICTLSGGGDVVARQLGGRLVASPDEAPPFRRLSNVVQEMAIASGVQAPRVYVLESEPGINAFAAGFTPADAVIGVTMGCVEGLSRNELQGVIAHEFSHILNGDMRISMQLIGVVFGILLIGMTGERLLFPSRRMVTGDRTRDVLFPSSASGGGGLFTRRIRGGGTGSLGLMLIGLALFAIGSIGVLFARMIKAAVSREREYLADASAVQFTRDPAGIAGALKKIGGYAGHSHLITPKAEEVSHMLLGTRRRPWFGLLATHPPILARIQAIEPRFRPEELARYGEEAAALVGATAEVGVLQEALGSVAGGLAGPLPDAAMRLVPENVAGSVANPTPAHIRYAAELLMATPSAVRAAAASEFGAAAVIFALLLSEDETLRGRQLSLIDDALGATHGAPTRRLYEEVRGLGPEFRLPLVDLALPAVQRCEPGMIRRVHGLISKLIEADARVDVFEYVLARLAQNRLADAMRPAAAGVSSRPAALGDCTEEARTLLSVVARIGNPGAEGARDAYDAGMHRLMGSRWPALAPEGPGGRPWAPALDAALARLDNVSMSGKRQLVEALAATIGRDGRVTVEECEIIRAICEALRCPLPPFIAVGPAD